MKLYETIGLEGAWLTFVDKELATKRVECQNDAAKFRIDFVDTILVLRSTMVSFQQTRSHHGTSTYEGDWVTSAVIEKSATKAIGRWKTWRRRKSASNYVHHEIPTNAPQSAPRNFFPIHQTLPSRVRFWRNVTGISKSDQADNNSTNRNDSWRQKLDKSYRVQPSALEHYETA